MKKSTDIRIGYRGWTAVMLATLAGYIADAAIWFIVNTRSACQWVKRQMRPKPTE